MANRTLQMRCIQNGQEGVPCFNPQSKLNESFDSKQQKQKTELPKAKSDSPAK
eukprot:Awhi_evm1s11850